MGAAKGNRNSVKHGKSGTRLYRIWKSMRIRCYCKTSPPYKNYGGRGITICKEWDDFDNFYNWAYANGYDDKAKYMECTLDRIDNDGNYEPSNCRWTNWKAQSINRRTVRKFEYKDSLLTLSELSLISGLKRELLYDRIVRQKWSVKRAITTPVR